MLENGDYSTEVASADINKHLTLEGNLSRNPDGSDDMAVATNLYKLADDSVVCQACSPSCIPNFLHVFAAGFVHGPIIRYNYSLYFTDNLLVCASSTCPVAVRQTEVTGVTHFDKTLPFFSYNLSITSCTYFVTF